MQNLNNFDDLTIILFPIQKNCILCNNSKSSYKFNHLFTVICVIMGVICKQALNRKLNCRVVLYLVVLTTRKKQVIKKKNTKNTCIHCTNKHYTTYKNPNGSCHIDPPNNKHVMFPSTWENQFYLHEKRSNIS